MNPLGSLCSGYSGLEQGIGMVLPINVRWVADYEPPTPKNPNPKQTAAKILAHHFPTVPNLGDITIVDWASTEQVRIICGGTPCQDVSAAGARAGMRAGTRSGIWSSMVEAIAHHRPTLVVWENVRGSLSATADSNVEPCPICLGDDRECTLRALGRVLGDLSELGYDAAWEVVAASDIGAPHRRERVFVVAWPTDPDRDTVRVEPVALAGGSGSAVAGQPAEDADGAARGQRRVAAPGQAPAGWSRADARRPDRTAVAPDPQDVRPHGPGLARARAGTGRGWHGTGGAGSENDDQPAADAHGAGQRERFRTITGRPELTPAELGFPHPATYAESDGRDEGRTEPAGIVGRPDASERGAVDWGPFTAAVRRWELVLGRPAPAPTGPTTRGGQALAPAFVEWLMGLEPGWVTQVPGLTRNEMLHALGNGVVPQQAAHALRRLLPHAPEWVRADLGLPPA